MPAAGDAPGRSVPPAEPDAAWAAGMTYAPTPEGRLFLAVVADSFSRRIAGWGMAAPTTRRRVVAALDPAARQRGVTAGLVAHADRGRQYAGDRHRAELRRHGVMGRVSGAGQCRDNAVVGSTFGRRKRELVRHETYVTREAARARLFEYGDGFFDRVRRHPALGDVSPAEYAWRHDPKRR